MSEILIKEIEMPKYCLETIGDNYKVVKICPFRELCIRKWGGYIGALNVHSDACPLVEVQTHGDLVDRQKLIKALSKAWDVDDDQDFANKSVWRIVEKEAPTVIEASTK